MNLSELIYKRFSESEGLTKYLTRFLNMPAIFSPEAPEDNQKGWHGMQYPKVVYNFDLQTNEERKSAGTLSVSLLCQNTEDVVPENIEPEVRKCLRDVILKPQGGMPYCFTWTRTDAFTLDDKSQAMIIGSEVRFDILEYPSQETTDPDPIMAMNAYMKKMYPECLVIGLDRMEEITEASKEHPVIYCRLVSIEKAEETYTVAWMDGKIAIHILCPDSKKRLKMETAAVNQMSMDGEIIMLDNSPMRIKRLQVNYKSDYLKDGQIFVTTHYGLLKGLIKQHGFKQIEIESK